MIIFDFDQTLVDTSSVERLRAAKNWSAVMVAVSKLPIYQGINELLAELHSVKRTLAIVTKSPDMVAKSFIQQHRWPINIVVGYHQVSRRKPDPEGLLLAMRKAGARQADTYHVGDRPEDTAASRAAGVTAIGSAWGATDVDALAASSPDYLFKTVGELQNFLFTAGLPNGRSINCTSRRSQLLG
ncbi:HAD family hydrolase [Rubellimicrobium roseum]|uniref:phosphoglycolate phosphatase n=1 Tax=Rubellimicrobium roseum TaxID=687525 RepID=A0A5C4NLT9_9RHOB|nr:HAD-IA family hydrolase [Rubellimicrobium roseum]TNC74358.1 HAD family hydrolase [Rubellimicrobium roseum]